jgi:hypothetical protein
MVRNARKYDGHSNTKEKVIRPALPHSQLRYIYTPYNLADFDTLETHF